jgi:hypothetical protein
MEDCRVARLRALAVARPTEAAWLNEEADATLAARAAGQSLWGSELSPLFLQLVLERLQWEPAVCGVMRLVCSTWGSILDALLPRLRPWGSAAVMNGKLGWYQSVTEVDLLDCEEADVSAVLAELESMPCLRSLALPASCAERAVDAEAVCGLTTLTTLRFNEELEFDEDDEPVVGEWVLDLSRLPTLTTTLNLENCIAVTDKVVLALSNLKGLMDLNLAGCKNITSKGLWAVSSSLTALCTLSLRCCRNVTSDGLRRVSNLTALTALDLWGIPAVTTEVLRALSSLTSLTSLNVGCCDNVETEGLRAVIK